MPYPSAAPPASCAITFTPPSPWPADVILPVSVATPLLCICTTPISIPVTLAATVTVSASFQRITPKAPAL